MRRRAARLGAPRGERPESGPSRQTARCQPHSPERDPDGLAAPAGGVGRRLVLAARRLGHFSRLGVQQVAMRFAAPQGRLLAAARQELELRKRWCRELPPQRAAQRTFRGPSAFRARGAIAQHAGGGLLLGRLREAHDALLVRVEAWKFHGHGVGAVAAQKDENRRCSGAARPDVVLCCVLSREPAHRVRRVPREGLS